MMYEELQGNMPASEQGMRLTIAYYYLEDKEPGKPFHSEIVGEAQQGQGRDGQRISRTFYGGSHGRLMIQIAVATGWPLSECKKLTGREVVTIMEELKSDA